MGETTKAVGTTCKTPRGVRAFVILGGANIEIAQVSKG